jgi:hypothetical protein
VGIYINKFIDRIRAMESRPQRELTMSLSEARDLHSDITKLLLALHELHEKSATTNKPSASNLEVDGGSF